MTPGPGEFRYTTVGLRGISGPRRVLNQDRKRLGTKNNFNLPEIHCVIWREETMRAAACQGTAKDFLRNYRNSYLE